MIAIPLTALFEGHLWQTLWSTVASVASVVALWAEQKARRPQADPVDELMDRLRHPVRWSLRHPIVAVRRKVDRRRSSGTDATI